MAKAQIRLPNGTDVQIEGTPEEVKKLLEIYSSGVSLEKKHPHLKRNVNAGKEKKRKTRKSGPVGLIKELVEEGYFKSQKRGLSDIQKKLEERGHIYAQTSLSPALTRLTRNRELRRIKEKKGWVYVV